MAASVTRRDPVAATADLAEVILKHVDWANMTDAGFTELTDALYLLAALSTRPVVTGPSLRSAIRTGFYAATYGREDAA
jgi:hypothetical protein